MSELGQSFPSRCAAPGVLGGDKAGLAGLEMARQGSLPLAVVILARFPQWLVPRYSLCEPGHGEG